MIGRVTPAGTITLFPLSTNGIPVGSTAGPNGALWFVEREANRIGRIIVARRVTEYPVPTGDSGPDDITAAPDGALWFTEFHAKQVGRFKP
jgi:virginiamycin B lyase